MNDSETNLALRQGHEIACEDNYFGARPQIDTLDRRKVFGAGFERGWEGALAVAPVQPAAQDERYLRRMLCVAFEKLPYMDDGEAQGQTLDWLRCPVQQIKVRIREIQSEKLVAAPAQPDTALVRQLVEALVWGDGSPPKRIRQQALHAAKMWLKGKP